jgi:putative tricarboxylic transport membrane protein
VPNFHTGRRTADILAALAMIAIGTLSAWSSRGLPPPMLEPVGPAAFPLWAGLGLIGLAVLLLVGTLRAAPPAGPLAIEQDTVRPRNDLALGTVVLALGYVAAMELEWLGFRWATVLFVLVTMQLLTPSGRRLRQLPFAAAIALMFGLLLHYLFTRFFYIDLPS